MRTYLTLVRLFGQQLIRRKSLWVVVALVGVVLLINAAISSQMKDLLEDGVRYEIASRRAAQSLEGYTEQVRLGALLLALIAGALIAPGSRKDGTTQFVLTLSVSRLKLAMAQFGAFAVLMLVGTLVVHVGFVTAAWRLCILRPAEAALGWIHLLVPLLLAAATTFSMSLTRPALVAYAILLGIPHLLLPLMEAFVGGWSRQVPELLRLVSARSIDNLELLFPSLDAFLVWPRIAWPVPDRPPHPAWGLEALHQLAAVALWITLGLWAYRGHDFGSRTPTK